MKTSLAKFYQDSAFLKPFLWSSMPYHFTLGPFREELLWNSKNAQRNIWFSVMTLNRANMSLKHPFPTIHFHSNSLTLLFTTRKPVIYPYLEVSFFQSLEKVNRTCGIAYDIYDISFADFSSIVALITWLLYMAPIARLLATYQKMFSSMCCYTTTMLWTITVSINMYSFMLYKCSWRFHHR